MSVCVAILGLLFATITTTGQMYMSCRNCFFFEGRFCSFLSSLPFFSLYLLASGFRSFLHRHSFIKQTFVIIVLLSRRASAGECWGIYKTRAANFFPFFSAIHPECVFMPSVCLEGGSY